VSAPTVRVVAGPRTGERRELPGAIESAAVLVVDVQRSFGDPAHYGPMPAESAADVAAAIVGLQRFIASARQLGVRVVWIRLEQVSDEPWQTAAWLHRAPPGGDGAPCRAGTEGADWYGVAPAPGELIVTKRRYSGFHGTDLADQLRTAGVTWVVVAGLTTECCVDSTARDAFQHEFPVFVAADATAAYDRALHENALDVLAINAAEITTTTELIDAWRVAGASRTGEGAPR
jgi:nicotinamidase-related amidase